jgi:nucleotidyltransferase substrate binding protein (TIGR01987 family)
MRNEEILYSLDKFREALNRLNEAIQLKDSPIIVDAVIQRFEFSFELAWKTLKRVLIAEGVMVQTPRDVLKEAFKLGYLEDEELWLDMLSDRNSMSHTYSQTQALEVYKNVPKYYEKLLCLSKKIEGLFLKTK